MMNDKENLDDSINKVGKSLHPSRAGSGMSIPVPQPLQKSGFNG